MQYISFCENDRKDIIMKRINHEKLNLLSIYIYIIHNKNYFNYLRRKYMVKIKML